MGHSPQTHHRHNKGKQSPPESALQKPALSTTYLTLSGKGPGVLYTANVERPQVFTHLSHYLGIVLLSKVAFLKVFPNRVIDHVITMLS
ncbi:uncharacterized protein GVI51_A01639 [Nakaseomyces glabratus]|uniref:Uncharacterized protein n=1 Tax=Candida glabrata (strain ATCC 2001 / BCRC 20586 / JCM 3761 / NBRC 0622 / NRRL Y-65 / CBS 138) TaxID=284593 RepID=Q6FY12_CANGA|nr:uncharacterized protein CAGL0A01892g [Nakaseomyces glabratus]KAH7609301.1 hypothetical protein J7293_00077 [Nakaseomyces glabratus]KAH7610175.1 hypothetical protein J7294_00078 [Nakaseomyces glabratus]QHS64465.1 uncharacterized protein GVI51_A01639 [Nakaseomyces glabratus]CAG57741.1 unnamed protein product [Nakaseomyces glabratus]|eukprot:XP_444848.1 uncharacterized protein CAGL0A01892g [[Candida] glabrata]